MLKLDSAVICHITVNVLSADIRLMSINTNGR